MKKRSVVWAVALLVFAVPLFAQTPNDFIIDLSKDFDAITITGYTGSAVKVVIPSEIEGIPVRAMGGRVFFERGITEIVIPDIVTVLGEGMFMSCSNLTKVVLPNNLTIIAANTFLYCNKLSAISIPNSVTVIGGSAFRGCSKLNSITLPSGIKFIDADTFSGCTSLTSITIPNGVTRIRDNAFKKSGLVSITIPGSIKTIDNYAFMECRSLKTVVFEDEEAKIDFGSAAFQGCSLDVKSQIALKKAGYGGTF